MKQACQVHSIAPSCACLAPLVLGDCRKSIGDLFAVRNDHPCVRSHLGTIAAAEFRNQESQANGATEKVDTGWHTRTAGCL
jgi:hypothetical protein